MHHIKTSESESFSSFFETLVLPQSDSHKGQNGKLLVVGGSSLFHAASLWAAEVSSHFVDMVHYSSTKENEEIFFSLKKKFRNGIIVSRKDLFNYAAEDDAVLIGPGMVRDDMLKHEDLVPKDELFELQNEASFTYFVTQHLIQDLPFKKFVFDAGALQMMEAEWLLKLKTKPIITPHQLEFERLFATSIQELSLEEKSKIVQQKAKEFNVVIMLKAVNDIVSDGEEVYSIEGGNAGLTKGGTGDVLSGLTASLYTKNDPLQSALIASILLKKSADILSLTKGYWYNVDDIIEQIPLTLKKLV